MRAAGMGAAGMGTAGMGVAGMGAAGMGAAGMGWLIKECTFCKMDISMITNIESVSLSYLGPSTYQLRPPR